MCPLLLANQRLEARLDRARDVSLVCSRLEQAVPIVFYVGFHNMLGRELACRCLPLG